MTDELISHLMDAGGIGLLAGFLIWQHIGMQKRLDGLVKSFQGQVDSLSNSFDARVEGIREKYDVVITKIRDECKADIDRITDQRDSIQAELAILIQTTNRKVDELLQR